VKTLFAGMVGLAVFGAFAGAADSRGNGAAKSERAAPRESNARRWRELGVLLDVFRAAPPGAYENAPRPAPAQAPTLKSARYRWPRETRRYIEKVRRRHARFPGDRWKRFTPTFVYSRQCA